MQAKWAKLPAGWRAAIWLGIGLIIGVGGAATDESAIKDAEGITARETSIIHEAEAHRDEMVDEADSAEARLDETNAELAKRESSSKKKLSRLRSQIRSSERTISRSSFEGDGTYIVGDDIEPGTYKSSGGEGCYWARLDKGGDIIDNEIGDGPAVVNVQPGDFSLRVSSCATFNK